MKDPKGFTLVELMVVLSVLAFVTITAIPAFEKLSRLIEADAEKSNWVQLLNYGRSVAATENTIVVLCPMANDECVNDMHERWVLFTDSDKSKSLDEGETVLRHFEPKEESTFGYYSAGVPYFRFGSHNSKVYQGMPEGFTFCPFGDLDDTAYHLTINIIGRVRVYNERDEDGAPLRKKDGSWIIAECDS